MSAIFADSQPEQATGAVDALWTKVCRDRQPDLPV